MPFQRALEELVAPIGVPDVAVIRKFVRYLIPAWEVEGTALEPRVFGLLIDLVTQMDEVVDILLSDMVVGRIVAALKLLTAHNCESDTLRARIRFGECSTAADLACRSRMMESVVKMLIGRELSVEIDFQHIIVLRLDFL
jgi:hypothetical protein